MTATHKLQEDDLLQLRADEFAHRYKVISKLGSGAFADVLRVKDLRGGQDCAVKVLRPAAAHPAGLQPEVALFREARALKHAKHPNIVGLQSVLRVPALGSSGLLKPSGSSSSLKGLTGGVCGNSSSGGSGSQHGSCWGLLLEYVKGGSLAQVIYKQMVNPYPRAYNDVAALTWAVDLAAAVAHLHGLSPCIIHRDLKLENILMQKPEANAAAPATRKLPVAKISDFGLHVMLETPPCPYLITSEGGCPVLLFGAELQQLQQQQQYSDSDVTAACTGIGAGNVPASSPESIPATIPADSAASGSFTAEVAACAGDNCSESQMLLLQKPCSSQCGSCNNSSSSKKLTGDSAAAVVEPAIAAAKPVQPPAPRGMKHVAFSASTRSLNGLQDAAVQQQQCLSPFACSAFNMDGNSEPLPQLQLPGATQQQQQQWQPLTTSTMRRMSLDSMASSGQGCGIPLALQLQGSSSCSRPGSAAAAAAGSAGFARVAVPTSALLRLSPFAAAVDGGECGCSDSGVGGSAGGGRCYDDVSDILAAANMERDYEVSMSEGLDRAASSTSWSRAPSIASSMHAGSCSRPTTPRAGSAAGGTAAAAGGGLVSLADVGSIGGRSWDAVPATTAASMLWEDMMEDDDCQELLDGPGVPACASGRLAYDLTQHTGSYMYMAPEIYRGDPYNESVDVFSLGVILYELFSRTLLLYTHTPACSPDDTEAYAARVSRGFRPNRPLSMSAGVWYIIERCWAAEPTARPAAAWVLQQLQQLLRDEEAAVAKAAALRSSTGVVGVLNRLRSAGRRSIDAIAAGRIAEHDDDADAPAPVGVLTRLCSTGRRSIDALTGARLSIAEHEDNADSAAAATADAGSCSVVGAGVASADDASGGSGDGKAVVVAAAVSCKQSLQETSLPAADDTAGVVAGSDTVNRARVKRGEPACGCVIC